MVFVRKNGYRHQLTLSPCAFAPSCGVSRPPVACYLVALNVLTLLFASGCVTQRMTQVPDHEPTPLVESADEREHDSVPSHRLVSAELELPAPTTEHLWVRGNSNKSYRDLDLEGAIREALQHSSVLRDIGGRLIQAPNLSRTIYGPSITATDPRFGIEGALSEYDAMFTTRAFFEKNDRVLNNELLGGGVNLFRQDMWRIQTELSKKAATGTQFAIRHNVIDDLNNATRNLFPRAWDWNLETEIRQPLLQGAGVDFNRTSGRSDSPGVANGVLIAQVNSRISASEFQIAVRDFISNVENAYWDLVYAYRDLDAKRAARDRTLATWQKLQTLQQQGIVQQDKVEQALEQYYRFEEEVENALYGRLVDGTRSFNGSAGGSFQGSGGVHVAERRLRLLMGLPVADSEVLRPATEAPSAEVLFDFDELATRALTDRVELRIQRMRVSRSELELSANRNYLLPELDLVARYRWRGFGDNLYDPNIPDLLSPDGDARSNRHEWLVGAEFSYPLGYRQAHSAVRNGQLRQARERVLLAEMERQVVHDASNALSNKDRAFKVMQAAFNRRESARKRYELLASERVLPARQQDFNLILDADRRLLDAETSFQRAKVEYALAIKNVNFEAGSLLNYCNVQLSTEPPMTSVVDHSSG